jgi:hypothetical protein
MPYYYERTEDVSLIESVLFDNEMFSRISEDGQLMDDLQIPICDLFHWIALYQDDTLLGIGAIHPQNNTSCEVHINILQQHRQHSKNCGWMMFDYFIKNTNYYKFNTHVPSCYPDVCKFLTNFGFTQQGIDYQSVVKNNILYDQILFGITRPQIIQQI